MKPIYSKSYREKAFRKVSLIVIILVTITVYGTVGFMLVESASFVDAFYMTFITMTTVGFGEVFILSVWGRLFTVSLIISGMIGWGISIAILSNLIFENTLCFKE